MYEQFDQVLHDQIGQGGLLSSASSVNCLILRGK